MEEIDNPYDRMRLSTENLSRFTAMFKISCPPNGIQMYVPLEGHKRPHAATKERLMGILDRNCY